jgi:hypothetical protein
VKKHDAATPPVQRKNETASHFRERARRFQNRVRPTLDEPRFTSHPTGTAFIRKAPTSRRHYHPIPLVSKNTKLNIRNVIHDPVSKSVLQFGKAK